MFEDSPNRKLQEGNAVYGSPFRYVVPTPAEHIAMEGSDFLVFDAGHGSPKPRDMAGGSGDITACAGNGSCLTVNSDVCSTAVTGHKAISVICDNGGFAVIGRLALDSNRTEFPHFLRTMRHERHVPVGFTKHAEAMAAIAREPEYLDDLLAIFVRTRAADHGDVVMADRAAPGPRTASGGRFEPQRQATVSTYALLMPISRPRRATDVGVHGDG